MLVWGKDGAEWGFGVRKVLWPPCSSLSALDDRGKAQGPVPSWFLAMAGTHRLGVML